MKFVYNQKKTDEISDILMMKPTLAEAQALLEKDETDGYALFKLGMALGLEKRAEEALEAFSKGIMYHPFYAPNYFGRGRRHNSMGHYYAALADFTMCIQLDPSVWTYRYYRATCESVHGDIESALSDFEECIPLTIPSQRYVIVHWLYTTYAELGLYDKAEESLEYVDGIVECPRRNYGYRRSVQLYKGIVKPEEYINEEEMARLVLPQPGRVALEENGMLYGLYWYWMIHGDEKKAYDAIKHLMKIAVPGAFGYTKAVPIARKLGIIE